MLKEIRLKVNDVLYELTVKTNQTLAEALRDNLGLIGTKIGCNEGECGACTVIINRRTIVSCLMLAVQADGAEITTIEGLSSKGKLHPVQQAFVEAGAIQCGFCTPGMVMSTIALLEEHPNPTDKEIKEGLDGNLCRCTGYQQIFNAVKLASRKLKREEDKKNEEG